METRWGGEEEVLEARVVAGCSGERREVTGSSSGRHGRWWMGWIGGWFVWIEGRRRWLAEGIWMGWIPRWDLGGGARRGIGLG